MRIVRAAFAALIGVFGAAALAQQGAVPPATSTAPAPQNPYQRVANPAAAVANPRDQKPFTNDSIANIKPGLPTLFIAGDSTAATGNATTRGWAALLIDYFDTGKVNLVNLAVGGERFNTYLSTGKWDKLVAAIKPGDFVVIEFGHNSGPLAGIGEETQQVAGRAGAAAVHTHGWYLRKFINDVKDKKGIPIASTLTLRDLWKDGKVERLKELTVGAGTGMSEWTRQVAAAEKVLLVDHGNIIGDVLDKLGPTEGDKLFGDHYLHTNTAGAVVNCEAFLAGLKALPDMPLVNDLNEKGKGIAAYKAAK